MKKYLSLLKNTQLFFGITEDEIESVLSCLSAVKRTYKKGEYIYRVGDNISGIAMLAEGGILIQKEDYWGNQSILTEISEGHIFGETYAFIESMPMEANAVAVLDSVVLMLDVKKIVTTCRSACKHHIQLIQNLISAFALKNKMLTMKLEHMSRRTTREKLLSYLSEQSQKARRASFDIPFNRQQLADYLAVDRSAMSNELCKLRDEGVLDFDRNHFKLKSDF